MTDYILNQEFIGEMLKDRMNFEMQAAAEPIIARALNEIEMTMRKKLGALIIAHIDHSLEIYRHGEELRITIKHDHGDQSL